MSVLTSHKVQFHLSHRLDGVSESATLKLNATVQALKSKGEDVINLTAGEPDFSAPEAAKKAIAEAITRNQSKYTPVPGIPELRQAVADKTNRQQPSLIEPWKAANVVITNGGKQAIFNFLLALINPGDEVLIPSPYWLSYPEMVKLAGGVSKFIHAPSSQGFKMSPAQLRESLKADASGHGKTKVLILNSPSNPTGMMYSKEEFRALADVLQEVPNVWVLSDEIYDRIILGETPFCSFLNAAPELAHRTITVNGMSKSAAMTGWRVGWSVAPSLLTQGMITLQGQSTSGINSLAQWASLAALKLPESEFSGQVASFQSRCKLVLENLKKASRLDIVSPSGSFYVFLGLKNYLKSGEDSIEFAQRLLEEAKVAVVPGTPFGEPSFVRISFATDEKTLVEGCRRIVSYLEKN